MNRIAILLVSFSCLAVAAQTPKPAPKAPVIPDALRAKFWKAQAQFKTAQEAMQRADAMNQEVVREIQVVCGSEYQPQIDAKGDPACFAKTKAK